MNSASSKIVYECVSQRDLSNLWPDEAVNVQRARPYLNHETHQHPIKQDGFLQTGSGCIATPGRVTSLVATVWKNPRYFRWVLTFAISVIFACMLGFINSFGVLYMFLREDLNSSATETGWVSSVAWSLCIFSPLITVCYQRIGMRLLSIIGIFLCFVGLLASSFARSIWILYVTFGLMFGVGINTVFVTSMNVITSYFGSDECVMPTTLPGVGATVGMLVFSPVLEKTYNRFGWRMSLRIIATIILVVGIGGSLLFRLPPQASESTPSNKTLLEKDGQQLRQIQSAECKLKRKKRRLETSKANYKMLLKDPIHWMFGVATLISNMALLCNVINLVELISSAGYSDEKAAFFMSIIGFVDTGGRLVVAFVGDRLPCSRILVIPVVCLVSGGVTFMLTLAKSTAAFIVYTTVVGISRAIMYSIIYATSVEAFGHKVYEESFAITLLMNGLGCLFSPLIPGLSFDLTGSYDIANYTFTVLWLLSCALFLAVYFMVNYRNKKLFEANAPRLHVVIEDKTIAAETDVAERKTFLSEQGSNLQGCGTVGTGGHEHVNTNTNRLTGIAHLVEPDFHSHGDEIDDVTDSVALPSYDAIVGDMIESTRPFSVTVELASDALPSYDTVVDCVTGYVSPSSSMVVDDIGETNSTSHDVDCAIDHYSPVIEVSLHNDHDSDIGDDDTRAECITFDRITSV